MDKRKYAGTTSTMVYFTKVKNTCIIFLGNCTQNLVILLHSPSNRAFFWVKYGKKRYVNNDWTPWQRA
jgi:hypothetical protein